MWKGAFGSNVFEVDPYFLKQMIGWDRAAGVDAVVQWNMPHEAGRIADHGGGNTAVLFCCLLCIHMPALDMSLSFSSWLCSG